MADPNAMCSYLPRSTSALRYRIFQRYRQEQLLQRKLSSWELPKQRLDTNHPKRSWQPQSGPHLAEGLLGLKIFLFWRSAEQTLNFAAGRNACVSSGKRGMCMFVTLSGVRKRKHPYYPIKNGTVASDLKGKLNWLEIRIKLLWAEYFRMHFL